MSLLATYAAVVGGFPAGVQMVRGIVRGAGKVIEGDVRGALTEAAGGFVAPVVSACSQVCRLGEDVFKSTAAFSGGREEES
jgi:hypothetical protein